MNDACAPSPPIPPLAEDLAGGGDPLAPWIADLERRAGHAVVARAARVELLLLDVDGVMTDGGLIREDDGLESKRFHARDTIGLRLLRASGVRVGIVSGRASPTLADRAEEIGVDALHQGVHDKREALARVLDELDISAERTAFVGDDVVDLPPMRRVHFAVAPGDAHPLVKAASHHVLGAGGGEAAVREVSELLMHAHGTLRAALAPYYR